ncbi:hypothetical protein CASFOL_031962 [Castilleja foliolosa]|uniref:Uncharacterized protein n=1 Tax=Castilleja foliolosa TaxID=1961234 RepID=A0ABD3BZ64_9LAMI
MVGLNSVGVVLVVLCSLQTCRKYFKDCVSRKIMCFALLKVQRKFPLVNLECPGS